MAALYTDDDVSPRLAIELGYLGHYATTSEAQNRKGAGDEAHLLAAAQQQWILITHNGKHFRMLHRAWHLWSHAWGVQPTHAGILVLAQTPRGLARQAAQEVDTFIRAATALTNMLYEWRPNTAWRRYP